MSGVPWWPFCERRANAVRDYMVANGVPSYRIETISYGEENPVAWLW